MAESSGFPLLLKRVVNRIVRPVGINPFPRAFENPLLDGLGSMKDVFEEIHDKNFWGSVESRSGVGSEVEYAERYRGGLRTLLREHGLWSIFDAPCGDLNWISELIDDETIQYSGGDISSDVMKTARARHPGVDLGVFDVTSDPFPAADVWHCRDCLFHLPLSAARMALINFARSSIPYALITSHRARLLHRNLDVGFGGFRFLDLEWEPFTLPTPLARIPDFAAGRDFPRYVCLWSREQIAHAVSRRST